MSAPTKKTLKFRDPVSGKTRAYALFTLPASGKVTDTDPGAGTARYVALEAASADGDIIEVLIAAAPVQRAGIRAVAALGRRRVRPRHARRRGGPGHRQPLAVAQRVRRKHP